MQSDLFRQACGMRAALPLDILYPGEQVMQRRIFREPCILIGRNPGNDICLPHERVSKRHAYLQVIGGRLFYLDLGSRTGLHHLGAARSQGWLDPGQALWVGPCAVRLPNRPTSESLGPETLDKDQETFTPAGSDPFPTAPIPPVGDGAVHVGNWPVQQHLTLVGSAPACGIRLPAPIVSRHHCALLRTGTSLWVIDLLGREGTRVNGGRVRWAELQNGDRLQIGSFDLPVQNHDLRSPHKSGATQTETPFRASSGATTLPVPQSLAVYRAENFETDPHTSELTPVLHQLAQFHQQMFGQFEQSMLQMVQIFGTLHERQMRAVKEELHQLRALTHELLSLRAEQARAAAASVICPSQPSPSCQDVHIPADGDSLASAGRQDNSPRSSDLGGESDPAPPDISKTATSTLPTLPTSARDSDASVSDMHAWLNERLAALDAERRTRWQRLIATLLGS